MGKWAEDEVQFLKDNYLNMTYLELSTHLKRTAPAIKTKLNKDLGLKRKVVKPITQVMEQDIINRYINGEQIKSIAKNFDINECRIISLLDRNNVHIYKRKRWTDEEIQYLKKSYAYEPWEVLENTLQSTKNNIMVKASKLGLKRENFFWSQHDIELAIKLYQGGYSYLDIYNYLDKKYSIKAISNKLGKLDIRDNNFWSEEEDNILLESYDKMKVEDLLVLLPNRTRDAVILRAGKLDVKNVCFWTDEEDSFIKNNYKYMTDMEMSDVLNNRNWRSIQWRRLELGFQREMNNTIGITCKSINGDICLSFEEKRITDYYIKNNIRYIKDNSKLKYSDYIENDNTNRMFDWIIFDKYNNKIFVEYFGMYRKTPRCEIEEKYKIKTAQKIQDCKNLNLLCIYPQDIQRNDMKRFKEKVWSKVNKIKL